ncbi:hypothetical protein ZWY2020_024485 [Hordeum vulgare]|nr:hypothetical protein ZWY2020_024485 [Hordeum vulgare]
MAWALGGVAMPGSLARSDRSRWSLGVGPCQRERLVRLLAGLARGNGASSVAGALERWEATNTHTHLFPSPFAISLLAVAARILLASTPAQGSDVRTASHRPELLRRDFRSIWISGLEERSMQ